MNKKEIFKLAKGFRGRAKNCIRIARERVEKALQYSYRDRRNKKRDMRSLWIQRINAGTRQHGVSLFSFFLFIFLPILLAGFSFVIEWMAFLFWGCCAFFWWSLDFSFVWFRFSWMNYWLAVWIENNEI